MNKNTGQANILTIDVEDYFQVENFKGVVKFSDWEKYECRVAENTDRVLRILSEADTKVTFFVLGWIAERLPGVVKKIYSAGHEIAAHSYNHQLVCKQNPDEFRLDLRRTKEILENIIQERITGYRAPTFSINHESNWSLDMLIEEGFKYDSSFSPTRGSRPADKENGLYPYKIERSNGTLWEFPVFSGGGCFRLLPYACFKWRIKQLNKKGYPAVIYLHPWELDEEQPRIKAGWLSRFRHYVNISKTEVKLMWLLKDFQFQPICEYLKNH